MEMIDKFYYSVENVDWRTISRFYGYTLEDTGAGRLRQFDPVPEIRPHALGRRTVRLLSAAGEVKRADSHDRGRRPT